MQRDIDKRLRIPISASRPAEGRSDCAVQVLKRPYPAGIDPEPLDVAGRCLLKRGLAIHNMIKPFWLFVF